MLAKRRLASGVSYGGWLTGDLTAPRELIWAVIVPFLLALAFLSLALLQEPMPEPRSLDEPEFVTPAVVDKPILPFVDRRQTDESYLPYRPVIR